MYFIDSLSFGEVLFTVPIKIEGKSIVRQEKRGDPEGYHSNCYDFAIAYNHRSLRGLLLCVKSQKPVRAIRTIKGGYCFERA
jgi:hypothetical protein